MTHTYEFLCKFINHHLYLFLFTRVVVPNFDSFYFTYTKLIVKYELIHLIPFEFVDILRIFQQYRIRIFIVFAAQKNIDISVGSSTETIACFYIDYVIGNYIRRWVWNIKITGYISC